MIKKLLLFFLWIAFLLDLVIGGIVLIGRESGLKVFKMQPNADTMYLAFIIGAFCLLVSALCFWAIILLRKENPAAGTLIYLLSFWWVALGLWCWFGFGKPNNLLSDTLKALILIVLNYLFIKQQKLKKPHQGSGI